MNTEFDRIYAATRDRLRRFLAGAVRSPQDGEEYFQEAYLRLWRQCGKSAPRRPGAWLVVVARRLAAARADDPVPQQLDEALPGNDRPALSLEIAEVLDCLDADRRETFCLRHLGGLSYAEIAAELDIPIGTVGSRIHDSLEILRHRLVGDLESEKTR